MKRLVAIFSIISSIIFLFSGCSHKHSWQEASCFSPKTCTSCGETVGNPIEHDWQPATCETPMQCSICGKTNGTASDHSWIEATENSPRTCTNCNSMEPLPLPKSGQVFLGSELYRRSQLSIVSSTTNSCYIKLKGTTGTDVFSFFVRAGDSVTVDVPSGTFYVYFSYGDDWYGTEHLFGDATTYSKDDEPCDFKNYTWSYELTPTSSGNFSETPIDEEEFK